MTTATFCRVFLLTCCLPIAACTEQPAAPPPAASSQQTTEAMIERGRLLTIVGGCHDCHTTKKMGPNGPEPDMSRMFSGHPENLKIDAPFAPAPGSPWTIVTNDTLTAWSGSWGVSFAANLTPDPNTGLRSGVWSEELFIKAIRSGKHMGTSRDILPPMPWPMYAQLGDDDLKAIWAYLGTVPPINNHVPEPIPPAAAPAK
jgi:cytochrome c553